MCIRKSARKFVLFWLGFESGRRGSLVIATVFINGMILNELGYPIKRTSTEKRINHIRQIAYIGDHLGKNAQGRKAMFNINVAK